MGPIYAHVARRHPRRVSVAVASPHQNFIRLNFILSLGRLSSDELSLNSDVFLGRRGPPGWIRRGLFFQSFVYVVFIDHFLSMNIN